MKKVDINTYCAQNDIWYLRLPIDIPEACLQEVLNIHQEGFFVPHGSKYSNGVPRTEKFGWHSTALYGFVHKSAPDTSLAWRHTINPDGYGMGENDVKWGWSEIAELAPEMVRWLKEFPHKYYRRCRYMLLLPGAEIMPHHDSKPSRDSQGRRRHISSAINIAITQPSGCYLRRCDTKEELPFEPFAGFWFDNGLMHEGHNDTDENRFHFIVHGGQNRERKRLMLQSLKTLVGNDVEKEIDLKL